MIIIKFMETNVLGHLREVGKIFEHLRDFHESTNGQDPPPGKKLINPGKSNQRLVDRYIVQDYLPSDKGMSILEKDWK